MILENETLKQHLAEMAKASQVEKRARGRPRHQEPFVDVCLRVFPEGHNGFTKKQAIEKVYGEGGPRISVSTFDRAMGGLIVKK